MSEDTNNKDFMNIEFKKKLGLNNSSEKIKNEIIKNTKENKAKNKEKK